MIQGNKTNFEIILLVMFNNSLQFLHGYTLPLLLILGANCYSRYRVLMELFMNISVVQIIKLGQKYIKCWPERAELSRYFSDYQAVQSARFVCRYFPALALFIFIMQLYFSSGFFLGTGSISNVLSALPQALVYGLFFLSIPVQALVVLGVKADKFLPPSLASWYRSGLEKAKQQGTQNKLSDLTMSKPRYIDLAQLLQLTYAASNK